MENIDPLCTPKKGLNLCVVFILPNRAFWEKELFRGLDLLGLIEGALLVWSEFAKGFCTGFLKRTV